VTELGLSLGLSPKESIDRFVGLLKSAEDKGIDAAWVVDSQLAMKDSYVALSVLARETDRIKLGPGVTNLVTRHETVIANAMNTISDYAPGRVMVGVGAGDSAVFPIGRKPTSVSECESGLNRLRELIRGNAVDYGGDECKGLSFTPTTVPPIYFSASQPRMLRVAGGYADGVIIMGPSDVETVRMQLAHVEAGARAAGRDPAEVRKDLWVTIAVGPGDGPVNDVKSWASAQARWLNSWRELPETLEPFRAEMRKAADEYDFSTHLSLSAAHAATISNEFAKVLAIAGPVDECQRRLSELAATGVDRITLTLLSGGRERRLDSIAEVWSGIRSSIAENAAIGLEAHS
jgi:5,10-methylenetetrahydromethanopterin reductase